MRGDWLLWLNSLGHIQVECSNCHHRIASSESIPKECPVCGSLNYDEDKEYKKAFLERWRINA